MGVASGFSHARGSVVGRPPPSQGFFFRQLVVKELFFAETVSLVLPRHISWV